MCRKRFGRSGWVKGVGWADTPWRDSMANHGGYFPDVFESKNYWSAGNGARANLAIRLSSLPPPTLGPAVWLSQASCRLQQRPCSSLASVFLNVRHFNKLGGKQPQLQWLGGALVRRGEGRGPAPNAGFRLSRHPKIKGGVGLTQPHASLVFFWGGGRLGRRSMCKSRCCWKFSHAQPLKTF